MTTDKKTIRELLTNIRNNNSCIYRNDKGNGSAGPCRINLGEQDMTDDEFEDFVLDMEFGDIVDHDEIVFTDCDGEDQTAIEMIQEAISAHRDTAIVSDDDIIVEDTDDNGWTGYYWIWSNN